MSNLVATLTALDRKLEAPRSKSTSNTVIHPSVTGIPYWVVNVPPSHWTAECPSFLRNLPEKSIGILSTPDERFQRQGWELVKQIIETNRIDQFQRLPSDLRKYLEYKERIVAQHGSVMRFVVKERLGWGEGHVEDLIPKGRPFDFDGHENGADDEGAPRLDDIRILYNDWPYGVEKGIVHLVVWTKFELEDDPVTDDLTPRARCEIDAYVKRTFCKRVPPEQVIWFKNWKSLKSVHAVEHFHVMLYHPDPAFIEEITGGDMPLIMKMC